MGNISMQANEFLLFSYFNIKFKDNYKNILEKVKARAYIDATMRGAYSGDNISNKLTNEQIKTLFNCTNKGEFDKNHKIICEELIMDNFTYGNAQKYVNMTLKYLLIVDEVFRAHNHSICELKNITNSKKFFHVPVDRYILESAWNLEDTNSKKEEKAIKFPYKDGVCKTKCGVFSADKIISWSKWDFKHYYCFQKSLQNHITNSTPYDYPIEWEFDAFVNAERD